MVNNQLREQLADRDYQVSNVDYKMKGPLVNIVYYHITDCDNNRSVSIVIEQDNHGSVLFINERGDYNQYRLLLNMTMEGQHCY